MKMAPKPSTAIPKGLQRHLPDDDYLDQWRMRSSDPSRPLVIVEGETDMKLFQAFFKRTTKIDYPPFDPDKKGFNNKKAVIAALYRLMGWKAKAVAGVIDADYERILGGILNLSNLFYTDEHDMEMQIIRSQAFRKFLTDSVEQTRFEVYWSQRGASDRDTIDLARDKVVSLAFEIGLHRMALFQIDPFEDFPPVCEQLCDKEMNLHVDYIFSELRNQGVDIESLSKVLSVLRRELGTEKAYQVSKGHDAAKLIAIALAHAFANKAPSPEQVESGLRRSYEFMHFKESGLYRNLEAWAQTNKIALF